MIFNIPVPLVIVDGLAFPRLLFYAAYLPLLYLLWLIEKIFSLPDGTFLAKTIVWIVATIWIFVPITIYLLVKHFKKTKG